MGLVTALAMAAVITDAGCSPTTQTALVNDLGPGADCALPIIVNGLLSGTEMQSLIDLAMRCGGETIAGLIQLVKDLEAAPPDAAPVPATPAALAGYHLGLSQLHAALLARQAGGAK